jgi:hypothetical protein
LSCGDQFDVINAVHFLNYTVTVKGYHLTIHALLILEGDDENLKGIFYNNYITSYENISSECSPSQL